MQLPLFKPGSTWVPPNLAELPSWKGCPRIGLDLETNDPNLKKTGPSVRTGGYIAGYSFALEDGPSAYIPIQHFGGGNLDRHQALKYLRHQARYYKGIIVGANLSYDLDYLAEVGIVFPRATFRDVLIAEPLLDELQNDYSLDGVAKRRGFLGKNMGTLLAACRDYGLKSPRSDLWKLPAKYVGEYGNEDAVLPLKVLRKQEREIDKRDMWGIYELECQLLPVLLRMRRRGVLIDQDALEKVRLWSLKEEAEQLALVTRATGIVMGLGDTEKKDIVVQVLHQIGVTPGKTATGQPQINKDLFERIDHPVAKHLARARKVNKLRTTYVKSINAHMVKGRIHTTFNQLRQTGKRGALVGGRFGRLSSCDPNLQAQPSRDDFASLWRSIYIPDHKDQEWLCADYSQQEPRWLTHFAELTTVSKYNSTILPGAKEFGDAYRNDPKTDTHQMTADICSIPRKPAKEIYLGICYGMGGATMSRKLSLPTRWLDKGNRKIEIAGAETQGFIDAIDSKLPFVRLLAARCEATARERGYIVTILGRHCHFPELPDGTYDWAYKSLNRLVQGSSGDQTKKALVEVDRAGFELQLQVHDELDLGIDNRQQAYDIGEIMETCVPSSVPSRVDLEVGPSWGQIKQIN